MRRSICPRNPGAQIQTICVNGLDARETVRSTHPKCVICGKPGSITISGYRVTFRSALKMISTGVVLETWCRDCAEWKDWNRKMILPVQFNCTQDAGGWDMTPKPDMELQLIHATNDEVWDAVDREKISATNPLEGETLPSIRLRLTDMWEKGQHESS